MERYEKSRSDREIVYWSLDANGNIIHEIGLPDGRVIAYDDYISNPEPGPRITPSTTHANAVPLFSATSIALSATLLAILLIFLHAL